VMAGDHTKLGHAGVNTFSNPLLLLVPILVVPHPKLV